MKEIQIGIVVGMLLLATTVPVVGAPTITIEERHLSPQSRGIEWNFTYDRGEFDAFRYTVQTKDKGYICCGMTEETNRFYILLLKLSANGTEEWHVINYDLNGTYVDPYTMDVHPFLILQAQDGGFLISGLSTISVDVQGQNIWTTAGFLWKTTATGSTEWVHHYYNVTELYVDLIYYSLEIPGGFVSTGSRYYFDMTGQVTEIDGFLLYTDTNGNIIWSNHYDTGGEDHLSSLCNTIDNGYILTGFTEGMNGALWMIKTNGTGVKEWEQKFDGPGFEYTYGNGCFQTSDGGYIMAGNTGSYGAGNIDTWVIKTNATGEEMWNRTYGYKYNDYTWCMNSLNNGDFVLAITQNYTYTGGTKDDILIVEFNEAGGTEWSYLIKQTGTQITTGIEQTDDQGFIIAARTGEYGVTSSDGLIIKIGPFPHFDIAFKGGLGIKLKITNSGKGDALQVPYILTAKGGILGLINETKNGTIDLLAGNDKSFLGLYLRFGNVIFSVKIAEKEQTVTAMLFGPFVILG